MRSIYQVYLAQLAQRKKVLHRWRLAFLGLTAFALAAACTAEARWERVTAGVLGVMAGVCVGLAHWLLRELRQQEAVVRKLEERYAQEAVAPSR